MNDAGTIFERAQAAAAIAAAHADDVDASARFPHEALDAFKRYRLLGVLATNPSHGLGGRFADAATVCRILGQACGSSALIYAMHQIQVACLVATAGNDNWHNSFLQRVGSEQLLLASVTSEVGVGGNIRSSLCAPSYEGDRLTLLKRSSAISYGDQADALLVTARRDQQASPSDQILVVAERADRSLVETSRWDTLGMRGTDSKAFDVSLSVDRQQIVPAAFADVARQVMLPTSHILWGSVWLGIATDATEKARLFLRRQAQTSPGTLPPGAVRLEKAISLLTSMRTRLDSATAGYLAGPQNGEEAMPIGLLAEANGLKIALSELALEIVQHAMLICGIAGYKYGTPYSIGRHLRDLQSAPLMVNNDRIAANTATLLVAQRAPLMKG